MAGNTVPGPPIVKEETEEANKFWALLFDAAATLREHCSLEEAESPGDDLSCAASFAVVGIGMVMPAATGKRASK